jgi:endoglucanase
MYLDRDTSGMYADKTETFAPDLGINRAKPFVDWLRANNLRGFIGEMGVPHYAPDAIVAMDNLLGYLRDNCVPITYWAAGPWWGNYILALDVTGGAEQPQLPVLRKHANTPNSCAAIGEPM